MKSQSMHILSSFLFAVSVGSVSAVVDLVYETREHFVKEAPVTASVIAFDWTVVRHANSDSVLAFEIERLKVVAKPVGTLSDVNREDQYIQVADLEIEIPSSIKSHTFFNERLRLSPVKHFRKINLISHVKYLCKNLPIQAFRFWRIRRLVELLKDRS